MQKELQSPEVTVSRTVPGSQVSDPQGWPSVQEQKKGNYNPSAKGTLANSV